MNADERWLESLLSSISDGRPTDWKAADSQSDAFGQKARVEALRDVERIAAFNRGLQRAVPAAGAGSAAAAPTAVQQWGELLLLERVGTGTSGEVFRAWDVQLQREVALKLIHAGANGEAAGVESPLIIEGRALARVRHPGVVAVHGIGKHDGRVGLWMEFVRGRTLEQEIERRGALAPDDVARIGAQLARALAAIHEAGLVHRDLKPANIVRADDGRVVIADFGLGQQQSPDESGRLSGTPMFMAPERLAGKPATPKTDLYALGATLWYVLAGRAPFGAKTLAELFESSAAGPKPTLREARPDAPELLVRAIEKAMAQRQEERFAGAAEMAAELEWVAEGAEDAKAESEAPVIATHVPRVASRRGVLLVTAVAAAAAVVTAVWIAANRPAGTPTTAAAPPVTATVLPATYDVEATLLARTNGENRRLATGDRVRPGDQLSLEFRASRPAYVYVLNEDERGESYLLFPQPLFDTKNPIPAGQGVLLPGPVGGRENAWTVTSRGGREHFLVVASPEPVAELEAELGKLPAPKVGATVSYARIAPPVMERLRGVGGVSEVPAETAPVKSATLARILGLAGRESGVKGVWVREVVLENPTR